MKKYIYILLSLFILCFSQTLLAVEADDILGVWVTENTEQGNAHIEISKENGRYFGKMVWLSNPVYAEGDPSGLAGQPVIDLQNPDKKLQSRPLIGLDMLSGFIFKNGRWAGGTIYDPESGKTYKCKIRLGKNNTLKVRGYIGVSLLGRSTVWTRLAADSNTEAK